MSKEVEENVECIPCTVAHHFLELVKQEFPNYQIGKAGQYEQVMAKQSYVIIRNFMDVFTDFVIRTLDVVEDQDLSGNFSQTSSQSSSQGSSWSQEKDCPLQDEKGNRIEERLVDNCTLERKTDILKIIEQHPNWSLETIQGRGCREFKDWSYKRRWEAQVLSGGTLYDKYKKIDETVYSKFGELRDEYKIVHDRDLQVWGLQVSQTFKDENFNFKASRHWCANFKVRHGIVSRKIIQLVSRREFREKDKILQAASDYQCSIQKLAANFNSHDIVNIDQTGFNYEVVSQRTLSVKREKLTLGFAQSPKNSVTHSYTVQYTISMAGYICGNVFVCLQEKSGRMGPKVESSLFKPDNATITCSTSGKLTTSLFEYYLDNVLVKCAKRDFLLVIDSWSGQVNPLLYEERFGVNGVPNCTVKIIPENCTSFCQPLDTTFHRQLKYFAREIHHHATLYRCNLTDRENEITTRNNIIKMQSLIHFQLSAPIFVPMIKYAWFSANLKPDMNLFVNVQGACFSFGPKESTQCQLTGKQHIPPFSGIRFIKCAYCRKNLCFPYFFYDYHICHLNIGSA